MTKVLQISPTLALPLEAITEKQAFLGRTGQGKSYAAQKEAELMLDIGAQVIALDPVGIWWGLRLKANGKSPGYQIPVFGGLHGDIPIEPGAGKIIADTVVDRNISAIIDVSQFESDTDKARFATDFANRFFFRKKQKPSACHLFLEEAQEFVPQNPQKEEGRMLHAYTRLFKIGRNFGVGGSLISQRPQEVNKKVLNLAEILFVFQLTGPQERKTVEWWIAEHDIDEDISSELTKLERGHPHVWSPALLKVSKVIHISKKDTFDASSTPKFGANAEEARELAPIDIENLRKSMAATIEKAKADDPRELRKEINALQAQLKRVPAPAVGKTEIKRVEVPVLRKGELNLLKRFIGIIEASAKHYNDSKHTMESALENAQTLVGDLRKLVEPPAPPVSETIKAIREAAPHVVRNAKEIRQMQEDMKNSAASKFPTSKDMNKNWPGVMPGLHPAGAKMLEVLMRNHPTLYTWADVATMTGLVTGNGYFNAARKSLIESGLVVVESGRVASVKPHPEIIDRIGPSDIFVLWKGKLSAPSPQMLEVIFERRAVGIKELSDAIGVKPGNGYWNTGVRKLIDAGLVERLDGGQTIRLTELLALS